MQKQTHYSLFHLYTMWPVSHIIVHKFFVVMLFVSQTEPI